MTREMFQAALDKIPQLVAEIAEYNGEEMWIEILRDITPFGTCLSEQPFVLAPLQVKDHLRRASRMNCEIEQFDDHIEVTRHMSDGSRFEVCYFPYIGMEG